MFARSAASAAMWAVARDSPAPWLFALAAVLGLGTSGSIVMVYSMLADLIPHDAERYRLRNVIERTFCRIKDFRGIATRSGQTARNFLAAVCLVSAITYWA